MISRSLAATNSIMPPRANIASGKTSVCRPGRGAPRPRCAGRRGPPRRRAAGRSARSDRVGDERAAGLERPLGEQQQRRRSREHEQRALQEQRRPVDRERARGGDTRRVELARVTTATRAATSVHEGQPRPARGRRRRGARTPRRARRRRPRRTGSASARARRSRPPGSVEAGHRGLR